MESVAQIIDRKGGPTRVAAALSRKPGLVRVWKHRNHFPRAVWPELIVTFPDLTMEVLLRSEDSTAQPQGRA
jgi:hypothetical protein